LYSLLRFKKARKKLIGNRRGFSSIVGAVFAVLVMMSLISTVFVWSLSQNTLYNNTVTQTRQADLDRSNEKIVADVNVSRDVTHTTTVWVNGTLENDGPLPVSIVTLWVVGTNASGSTYANSPLSITLKPGYNITTAINVALAKLDGEGLSCWFITARGNTISEKSLSPTIINYNNGNEIPPFAYTSGGIGSLAFVFESLTYFTVSNNIFAPYPSGHPAYKVPAVNNLVFGFNITNYNINKYNITLDGGANGGTFMWSYFASVPGHTLGPVWSLVSNQTNTISTTYSPITLEYNVTRFLLFSLQSTKFGQDQQGAVGAINLVFYGNYTTTSNGNTVVQGNYGQNVPFVTIYFTAP
jgi:hypothetical protein